MRSIVKAPALREAKHSLVNVGNVVNTGDNRWEDGVVFTPVGCPTVFGHIPICVSEDKSPYYDCPPPVEATPYLLEVGLQWSTMDLGVDPKEMLEDALRFGTSSVLERLSTSGIADVAGATPLTLPVRAGTVVTGGVVGRVMAGATAPPTLASALDVGGTHTTAQQAIGALEAKLLDSGDHIPGSGTILMSAYTAATSNGALVRDSDGNLRTLATDSLVVVGNIAAQGTIYGVVGDIDVYLGDIINVEFTDRAKNEWIGRAERRAIAVWNPCVAFKSSYTAA
jgi:hypothetical protein